jgi:hypothetical protein
LKQLDDLTAALAAAKNGPAGIKSDLAKLNDEYTTTQNKHVGYTRDPVADTANGVSRFLTGHTVVDSGTNYSQEEKNADLASIQKKIDADNARLSQVASPEEAQRRYDEFVAHVPW